MKFKINKKKQTKPTQPNEQELIEESIIQPINNTDIFGRKANKRKNTILLMEPYLIEWRQKLIDTCRKKFWIITSFIALISLLLIIILPGIILTVLSGVLGTGAIIGFYLLLSVKLQYITGVSNALQIPTFNDLIQLTYNTIKNGDTDLTKVSQRLAFKKYNSYITLYLSSSKNSTTLIDFLKFTQKIPKRLKNQVSKTLNMPMINVANKIYNTDNINAVKPLDDNRELGDALNNPKNSMVGVSLAAIARDGVKKRGGRAKNVQEAIHELELMEESKEFIKGIEFKNTAPWYFKLFSAQQIDNMLEMNMTPKAMTKWQINRIMKAAMIGGVIAIIPFVAMITQKFVPQVAVAANPMYAFIGLFIGLGYYQMQAKEITSALNSWRFKRGMAFSQLTQIIVPYLFLMKVHGGSLIEVFTNVSNRLENNNDKALVVKLIREMRDDPNSDQPFINFAKAFTNDPNAVVFMTAVNRSAQSNGSNDVIEDLAQRAQAELLEKVKLIKARKIHKLGLLPTYVTIIGMIINLFMVMTAMLNQMTAAMG